MQYGLIIKMNIEETVSRSACLSVQSFPSEETSQFSMSCARCSCFKSISWTLQQGTSLKNARNSFYSPPNRPMCRFLKLNKRVLLKKKVKLNEVIKRQLKTYCFYKQTQGGHALSPLGFDLLFLFVLLQEGRGSELFLLLVRRFGGRALGRQSLFDLLAGLHGNLHAFDACGQLAHALDELIIFAVVVFAV